MVELMREGVALSRSPGPQMGWGSCDDIMRTPGILA